MSSTKENRESQEDQFANIIGTSKPMQELFRMIRRVAPTNATGPYPRRKRWLGKN